MIPYMNQHHQSGQLLPWSQCEALQQGVLPGVVQRMKMAGEGNLLTEIVLLVQVPGQVKHFSKNEGGYTIC
jgi:hypothetical protein